jgi:hypothetical protein
MSRDTTETEGEAGPDRRASRREFVATTGSLIGLTATAGCLSGLGFETQSARVPPLVEDRPEAVYHPTHVESMEMVGTASAGPYRLALSYSFPHRFWTIEGGERSKVAIGADDSMHLMVSVWHEEAGVVTPTVIPAVETTRDGETVDRRNPWSMLSQRMGFHFGDNVQLEESGTHDVAVVIEPPTSRWIGSLGAAPEETVAASLELDFDPEAVRNLEFTQFSEKAGTTDALEPIDMAGPRRSQLPPAEDLPGEPVSGGDGDEGVFAVRLLESPPEGLDVSGTYLAVSARTPYNRYPLALMSLSATLGRGGETRFGGALTPTLDPEMGYHYGTTLGTVESGDEIAIEVDTPPGMARHEGYETAFFELGPVTVEI